MNKSLKKLWQEYAVARKATAAVWPNFDFEKGAPTEAFQKARAEQHRLLNLIDSYQVERHAHGATYTFREPVTDVRDHTYRSNNGVYPCKTLIGTTDDGEEIFARHKDQDGYRIF